MGKTYTRKLIAGQPGTKKLHQEFGERLLCVRYRYEMQPEPEQRPLNSSWKRNPGQENRGVFPATRLSVFGLTTEKNVCESS